MVSRHEAPREDLGNVHTIDQQHRTNQWHPKLTPYRLWVILTTLAFGTAKAVESHAGNHVLPTTLEWVTGTVLFLITFILGTYESGERADIPRFLLWMFELDCMDVVWRLCAVFSIKPPKYDREDLVPAYARNSSLNASGVVITPYRFLVSLTVVLFGLSKAIMSYLEQATSMNWTDWLLGVPLSTGFYILGLYEYNGSNLWPAFFVVDRTDAILWGISHIIITGAFIILFLFSILGIVGMVRYPDHILKFRKVDLEASTMRRLLNGLFYNAVHWFVIAMLFLAAILFLRELGNRLPRLKSFVLNQARRGLRTIHKFFMWTGPIIGGQQTYTQRAWSSLVRVARRVRLHRMFKPCLHVFLHVMGLICGVFFGGFMANVAWDVYDGVVSESKGDTRSLFGAGPIIVLALIISSLFTNYPVCS